MLTKSLHTITAATNIAAHLVRSGKWHAHGWMLAHDALDILGYGDTVTFDSTDPTVQRIVKACDKLVAERSNAKAAA